MSYTKLIDHIYSLKDTFFGVVYDEDSRTGRKIYDRFQIFLTETSRHYNYPRKIVHMAEQISEALFVAENIDVRHDLFAVGNLIGIVIGNVDKIPEDIVKIVLQMHDSGLIDPVSVKYGYFFHDKRLPVPFSDIL